MPKLPPIPTTPSMPTPVANPNIGYHAIAFSTATASLKDPNLYLNTTALYYMTPFRDRFATLLPTTANPASGITGNKIMPQDIRITRQ